MGDLKEREVVVVAAVLLDVVGVVESNIPAALASTWPKYKAAMVVWEENFLENSWTQSG